MELPPNDKPLILITGATGYVGGRLAGRLHARGYRLRCMARSPAQLAERLPAEVEVVAGDVTEASTLDAPLAGVHTAFYLVHALAGGGDFESTELAGARNFAAAAKRRGIQRIVYLGGLGDSKSPSSAHMRSRHAVGEILRSSGVPAIEFRASIIIGSGSLSFELIRSLVQRLPIMVVPRWVRVQAQPISIQDVLAYLEEAITAPLEGSTTYEIGGAERMSYLDVMRCYGELTGLRRIYVNVPFLTPWLSSLWLNLVTPLFAKVGRKLIDSIRVASVVADDKAIRDFSVRPVGATEAIRLALEEEDRAFVETHWSDALSASPERAQYGGQKVGSRIVDSRTLEVASDPAAAFRSIEAIGGRTGWYYGDWLWRIRGFLDRCVGGVGMQRGRRDPNRLRKGDVVDCWRVEEIERPRRLLLRAEMKVFGRAWLQFEVTPKGEHTEIRQTAVYDPRGLMGRIYWYALYPLHGLLFRGMLKGVAKASLPKKRRGEVGAARKTKAERDSLPKA